MTATPIYDAMVRGRRFSSPYYVFQRADDSWERRMFAIRYSYALAGYTRLARAAGEITDDTPEQYR